MMACSAAPESALTRPNRDQDPGNKSMFSQSTGVKQLTHLARQARFEIQFLAVWQQNLLAAEG